MAVIESCARGMDLGNSVFTLLISLTYFSIFLFNPTETPARDIWLYDMTWLGEIKPNGSYIEAT